ncbi:MAG: PDZ domain-containing protein [Alphaproteobacteria bacterium]|nr:PDZ domain-containing protein [Alphaproteobacteria bacterium]
MNRREMLHRIGGVLALSLTPVVSGCATVGGPDLASFADQPPVHLADQLRERMAAIRGTASFPRIEAWVEARGQDRGLLGEVAATMWLSSTFRDLPRTVRAQPEIQRWLLDEGPAVARSMYQVAELLEGLGPEERRELREVLASEPELLGQMTEGFDVHAAARGVEPERRAQAKELLDHTAWRLRHQSPDAVIDELLHRFDRICRRNGVDRRDWREGLEAELPLWRSLELVADPDGPLAEHATNGIDAADVTVPLDTTGAHLGVTLRSRGRVAEVEHVPSGSPAAAAGLRSGDVVRAVNGLELDASALIGWLATRASGDSVSLTVRRAGEDLALTASLGAGPGDRLVVDRPNAVARGRLAYMTGAWTVTGIGLIITSVGFGSFLLGIAFMAAGGLEGIGAVGAVMTILGILVIGAGLVVFLIGLLMVAVKHRNEPRDLSEPETAEDLPAPSP